jgi:hypothetical protein
MEHPMDRSRSAVLKPSMAPRAWDNGSRIHGTDHQKCRCKETAVNDVKCDSTMKLPVEKLELLDCGKASEVTKGLPFLMLFEWSAPPFDRALV